MRFLADENVSEQTVISLRERDHDVWWARSDASGSADSDLLARAQVERRIVLTFDKDFGELAFRFGLPADAGIILFRVPIRSAEHEARLVLATLEISQSWAGFFTVVEPGRLRITPLPSH